MSDPNAVVDRVDIDRTAPGGATDDAAASRDERPGVAPRADDRSLRSVSTVDHAAPASADPPVVADGVRPRASRARRPAPSEQRVADEAAFVLHGYPYKETSLIVDVLTRHHGRVALVARGAKRPRSALRSVLLAFQPLTVSWVQSRARTVTGSSAGGDLHTLTRAEWIGGLKPLRGEALMSGFYLNELIQKLLARNDPHERLFDAYLQTLGALSDDRAAAPVLRHFETVLLREAGYATHGDRAADGGPIDPEASYRYVPERGPIALDARDAGRVDADSIVVGKTLLDLDAGVFDDATTLAQSKRLMRFLLQHHLAGQVLQTRRMVLDLQSLEEGAGR